MSTRWERFSLFPFLCQAQGAHGQQRRQVLFVLGLYLGACLMLISLMVTLAICTGLLIRRTVRRSDIRVRLPLAPILSLGAVAAVALSYLF